jgi:hypothetical protein
MKKTRSRKSRDTVPLTGAHTVIWLEREDLCSSLLLGTGQMFRQGN